MTVHHRLLRLLLVALLLSAATAHADEFKTHYDLALALYQAQRFEDSIPEFKAAYQITPKPGLLFNLAQAYRKAGHPREAIEYYDKYLSAAPSLDDDTRHKVDGYLAEARNTLAALELEMKQRLAEEKAARERESPPPPAPVQAPPPVAAPAPAVPAVAVGVAVQPPPRPVYRKWWFWTILGSAVTVGVIAGVSVSAAANSGPSLPVGAAGARGTLFY